MLQSQLELAPPVVIFSVLVLQVGKRRVDIMTMLCPEPQMILWKNMVIISP